MNPSFQTWTSRAIVFADAMQRAREFSYWRDGTQGRAPLIPSGQGLAGAGWPDPSYLGSGERYGALLFGSMEGTLPDGRTSPYVVTWEGRGSCRLEGVFVIGERNRAANRVEVLVDPTTGSGNSYLACSWTATDRGDPVRSVHVWLPEMEPSPANGNGRIFWPPFLSKLRDMNAGRGPH